jgi:hypothetical protein
MAAHSFRSSRLEAIFGRVDKVSGRTVDWAGFLAGLTRAVQAPVQLRLQLCVCQVQEVLGVSNHLVFMRNQLVRYLHS